MADLFSNIAEEQLLNILNQVREISEELDIDVDDIDETQLLGGPLDNIQKVIDGGKYAIGKYNEIVSKGGIIGEGKNVVIEEINKIKGVFKATGNKVNPPFGGGGDIPRGYDLSGGERARNVQAAGAKPIEVKFDTDITVRTYGDIDMTSDKVLMKYPLILSRQSLDFSQFYKQKVDTTTGQLEYNTESIMASYVNSILNKLNNITQANVNYATSFTYQEIANWLSILCKSLNAYYGVYSIVQFEQSFENKNEGMAFLRRGITAEDFNYIDTFVTDLMSVPMPGRLPDLFYMLNANYRFEDLPKSPIIKITSADITTQNSLNFNITKRITELNETKFRETCRKIFRAVPTWRRAEIPMYGPETYHSRNFNTIFMNSGHVAKNLPVANSKWQYQPTFDSSKEGFHSMEHLYYSNTNDLDGLTTALYCAWDSKNDTTTTEDIEPWLTGLFKPIAFSAFDDNRAQFSGNQLARIVPTQRHQIPFIHEVDYVNGSVNDIGFGVNREQIYGLSIVALRETSKELMDWMFDLGSIPMRNVAEKENSKSKPKRTRNKKGRRSTLKGKVESIIDKENG